MLGLRFVCAVFVDVVVVVVFMQNHRTMLYSRKPTLALTFQQA